MGERILDVFAREFRAHPAEEYERCIQAGTLTVNYEKVPTDYKLKHNDLLANVVHRWVLDVAWINRIGWVSNRRGNFCEIPRAPLPRMNYSSNLAAK